MERLVGILACLVPSLPYGGTADELFEFVFLSDETSISGVVVMQNGANCLVGSLLQGPVQGLDGECVEGGSAEQHSFRFVRGAENGEFCKAFGGL